MIYPAHIYPDVEIVQKEIAGDIHYGLLRQHWFLGVIPYKRMVQIRTISNTSAYESSYMSTRWVPYKAQVQDVIRGFRMEAEWKYAEKLRK